jgi:Brp/Blh family beta-carotene 15,15'-monooxygenase
MNRQKAARGAATTRTVLAVGALYLVLSGLYLVLWFAAPRAAFCLFIALTAFHWGAGDLHALLAFGPAKLREVGYATRVLVLLSRGGIPMIVPLLAFPGVYRAVAEDTVGLFGAGGLTFAFSPGFRAAAGTVLFAVVLLSVLSGARELGKDRRLLLSYAGETLLLVLYFAAVPPVLAVGLYFCLWHSTRHIARLVALDRSAAAAFGTGRVVPAGFRFARDATPLTAAALLLLGGLFFSVPGSVEGPGPLLALYLVLVSSLTLPHAVVVSYMDLRQGLWPRAKGRYDSWRAG